MDERKKSDHSFPELLVNMYSYTCNHSKGYGSRVNNYTCNCYKQCAPTGVESDQVRNMVPSSRHFVQQNQCNGNRFVNNNSTLICSENHNNVNQQNKCNGNRFVNNNSTLICSKSHNNANQFQDVAINQCTSDYLNTHFSMYVRPPLPYYYDDHSCAFNPRKNFRNIIADSSVSASRSETHFSKTPYTRFEKKQWLDGQIGKVPKVNYAITKEADNSKQQHQKQNSISCLQQQDPSNNFITNSSSNNSSLCSDLDYLETQFQNTSKNGYVTLDNKSMTVLMKIISNILPNDIDLSVLENNEEKSAVIKNQPVALGRAQNEASNSTCSKNEVEEFVKEWEPPKDKDSLQKLFDLHFC